MNEVTSNLEPVRVLWTGGWDSTFQLLKLLLLEKRRVEPYYLIDEDRPSTGIELLTMKRIRLRIRELNEPAAALIQPTKFFSVSEIPVCPKVTQAYENIRQSRFIGSQYDWISRFCEDQGISGLQLCIHEDDKAAVIVAPIATTAQRDNHSFRIDDRYSGTNEHTLFKYFEFPVLKLTKGEMGQIARENDWSETMEMTWFCHRPRMGKPCGRCNPCRYTIEEGLGRRIPICRRLLGSVHRLTVRPAKNLARKAFIALRRNRGPAA